MGVQSGTATMRRFFKMPVKFIGQEKYRAKQKIKKKTTRHT
jgi:hypothetical protein